MFLLSRAGRLCYTITFDTSYLFCSSNLELKAEESQPEPVMVIDDHEESSNGASTIQKSTKLIQLPTFSEYVRSQLNEEKSHVVWSRAVQEAAYFYIERIPAIGQDRSSSMYRVIKDMLKPKCDDMHCPGIGLNH